MTSEMVKQLLGIDRVLSGFQTVEAGATELRLPRYYVNVDTLPCKKTPVRDGHNRTVSKLGLLAFLGEKIRAGNEV